MSQCKIVGGIGKGSTQVSPLEKLLYGPVVDKFFLIGYLAGVIGTVFLGLYLWLMLTGLISISAEYQQLRKLHASVQIYLFMAPFICGFFIQAGPKLFETRLGNKQSNIILLVPWLLILPAYFISIESARIICLIGLLAALWRVVGYIFKSSYAGIIRSGLTASFSLAGLACGLYLPIEVPQVALFVIWVGIIGSIFSAEQQFIFGVLGGRRLSNQQAWAITILVVSIAACFYLTHIKYNLIFNQIASGLIILLVAINATGTHLYKDLYTRLATTLGLATVTGHGWLLFGASWLLFSPTSTSLVIHCWVLGLAIPLIISISTRVVYFPNPAADSRLYWLHKCLIIWQLVPILRAFPSVVVYPMITSSILTMVVVITIWIWGRQLLPSALTMMRRPFLKHVS